MRLHRLLAALVAASLSTAAQAATAPRPTAMIGANIGGTAEVAAYEAALGRPIVLINRFNGENAKWTGGNSIASSANWLMKQSWMQVAKPPRRLVYGIHLGISLPWPKNTTGLTKAQFDSKNFAEIAAGLHDDAYTSVGRALLNAGYGNAYIRLGQEGNGEWFPGCICSDKPGFVAAFNHVAALLKAISPDFVIVVDLAADRTIIAATAGIDWSLVGLINLDMYDMKWYGADPVARWSYLLSHGINAWIALGKATGKPLAILEWGVGAMGDNPYMVSKVAQLAANPANNIVALAYWQSTTSYNAVLSPTHNPLSWAEYIRAFGGAR